jgi:hypothetical protein
MLSALGIGLLCLSPAWLGAADAEPCAALEDRRGTQTENFQHWMDLAQCHLQQGHDFRAGECLQQALAYDHENSPALVLLYGCLKRTGHWAEARALWEHARPAVRTRLGAAEGWGPLHHLSFKAMGCPSAGAVSALSRPEASLLYAEEHGPGRLWAAQAELSFWLGAGASLSLGASGLGASTKDHYLALGQDRDFETWTRRNEGLLRFDWQGQSGWSASAAWRGRDTLAQSTGVAYDTAAQSYSFPALQAAYQDQASRLELARRWSTRSSGSLELGLQGAAADLQGGRQWQAGLSIRAYPFDDLDLVLGQSALLAAEGDALRFLACSELSARLDPQVWATLRAVGPEARHWIGPGAELVLDAARSLGYSFSAELTCFVTPAWRLDLGLTQYAPVVAALALDASGRWSNADQAQSYPVLHGGVQWTL